MVTIQKNYPCFKEFKFLLKASNKNSIKDVYQKMFLDELNGKIVCVCTDGQRLHIVTDTFDMFKDREKGLYDIIKNDAKEIVFNKSECQDMFPNYKQIIPENQIMFHSFEVPKNTDTIISKILYQFYKKYPESSLCFNENFVHDAFIEGQHVHFNVSEFNAQMAYYKEPFVLSYAKGEIQAIIMPINTVTY